MITIQQIVDEVLRNKPFYEEALSEDLLNLSSLARKLQPEIEKKLMKEVKTSAISAAISRHNFGNLTYNFTKLVNKSKNIANIISQSRISMITMKNSLTLTNNYKKLVENTIEGTAGVLAFTRGIYESMIMINDEYFDFAIKCFEDEHFISKQKDLCIITLLLPRGCDELPGFYYHILKQLAVDGINIYEVISTSNEFSLILENEFLEKAFSILNRMRY